jgi:hypothetical protein
MANYFTLTLDTTGPAGVTIAFPGATVTTRDVTVTITTSDEPTTGYMMKIWGDVDPAFDTNIQGSEGTSQWITFSASKAIRLSAGDGPKSIYCKVRDDVYNESSQASASVTVDSTLPTPSIQTGPDTTRISLQTGKDTCIFTWNCPEDIQAYKVKVVPATDSPHGAGVQIPTTGGSTNVAGDAVTASTTITTTLKGVDIKAADNPDGDKIIKLFVQDLSGNWSV